MAAAAPETTRQVDPWSPTPRPPGSGPSLVTRRGPRRRHWSHVAAAGDARPGARRRDIQYRIGSITKTMTAVLVLQQRDAGRLALDDPLERHLPGTPVGAVTLRQLLGHACGLQREPDGDGGGSGAGRRPGHPAGRAHPGKARPPAAPHLPLLEPGIRAARRGAGTGHRRALVETAPEPATRPTGHAPHHLPAGASRSPGATSYTRGTARCARSHVPTPGRWRPPGNSGRPVADLARWAAFLADPDPAMLAAETLTEMCVPVMISDLDSWTGGHGLGTGAVPRRRPGVRRARRLDARLRRGPGGAPAIAHRGGRLRQRVRLPVRLASARSAVRY